MKTPHYEQTRHQPLTSDALIEERVAAIVGRASRRQLWFLFLDKDDVQLPLLIPLDDLPPTPDHTVGDVTRGISHTMEAIGAHSVIVVIERYAGSALHPSDTRWAKAIHRACDNDGVMLRGILLSHNRGVRWVAQDDYRFDGA